LSMLMFMFSEKSRSVECEEWTGNSEQGRRGEKMILNLGFRPSAFFRHSSFVIRLFTSKQCTRQKVAKKTVYSPGKSALRTSPIYDTRENNLKTA
jgi:hypothetical protein